jgi:hypothetical protein
MRHGRNSISRYVSVRELVFDIIIVLFTAFVLRQINPDGKKLLEVMSPAGVLVLGLGINFAITLFMGSLYRSYSEYFDTGVMTVLVRFVFFLGITGMYLASILFFAAYRVMPWTGLAREMDILIVLIPAYPLFWGVSCAFSMEEIRNIKYVLYVPMTVTVPLVPVGAAIIGYHTRWYVGLIFFVILVLALVVPFMVRTILEKKSNARLLREMRDQRENDQTAQQSPAGVMAEKGIAGISLHGAIGAWDELVLPPMAALAMLFWQNMTVEMLARAYRNWNMIPDTNVIFWSLILSGIVPLRVILQLAPPLKPVNMAISVASLAYYIFSLFRFTH